MIETTGDIVLSSPRPSLIWVTVAYLIGSIPFGLILSKVFGLGNIRKIGSGNIGATNVLRTGNKLLALFTLLLDGLKGAFLILILPIHYSHFYYDHPGYFLNIYDFRHIYISIGFAAIIGHCFPVWLKFKGGKGVATAFGVLLAAVPWAGIIAAVTWGIVAGFFRYSSLAALCAMVMAPVAVVIFYGVAPAMITLLITLLVFWRHRENIQRLFAGTESKIGEKKD